MTKKVNICKICDCEISGFHYAEMTVFWDVIPSNQMDLTDVSEEHAALVSRDEGSAFLRIADKILPNYTLSHLRREFFFFQSYD